MMFEMEYRVVRILYRRHGRIVTRDVSPQKTYRRHGRIAAGDVSSPENHRRKRRDLSQIEERALLLNKTHRSFFTFVFCIDIGIFLIENYLG